MFALEVGNQGELLSYTDARKGCCGILQLNNLDFQPSARIAGDLSPCQYRYGHRSLARLISALIDVEHAGFKWAGTIIRPIMSGLRTSSKQRRNSRC
jgi:hypothetical protein